MAAPSKFFFLNDDIVTVKFEKDMRLEGESRLPRCAAALLNEEIERIKAFDRHVERMGLAFREKYLNALRTPRETFEFEGLRYHNAAIDGRLVPFHFEIVPSNGPKSKVEHIRGHMPFNKAMAIKSNIFGEIKPCPLPRGLRMVEFFR